MLSQREKLNYVGDKSVVFLLFYPSQTTTLSTKIAGNLVQLKGSVVRQPIFLRFTSFILLNVDNVYGTRALTSR